MHAVRHRAQHLGVGRRRPPAPVHPAPDRPGAHQGGDQGRARGGVRPAGPRRPLARRLRLRGVDRPRGARAARAARRGARRPPPAGRAQRRRRRGRRDGRAAASVVAAAPAPPAAGGEHHAEQREQPEHRGHDPRRGVEAAARGDGEHPRPVLRLELRLDLLLRAPLVDPALDELALAVGDGGLRDVERRAALRAHHLVLDVGQRRARRRGERRRGGEQQREDERGGGEQPPHHAFSAISFGRVRSSHAWSTGPRRLAAMRPLRSITNVSG